MQAAIGKRVAVIGAGLGGVSAAIALRMAGHPVRIYDQSPAPQALGGAVLLSVPVLAVLRHYGIDVVNNFGQKTRVQFRNAKGKVRVDLPFNAKVEAAMGIPGWHYGILRASAFARILTAGNGIDPDILVPDHRCIGDELRGQEVTADILAGADGNRTTVPRQDFGDPDLFHIGLRVWLAWCQDIASQPHDASRAHDIGALRHGRDRQASHFPMTHDGRAAFGRNVFCCEICNRPSLQSCSRGCVVCLGDAAHPVSPDAAYGMDIEKGFFGRAPDGGNLADLGVEKTAFAQFDTEPIAYFTHQSESAALGNQFDHAPAAVALLRVKVFDHTGLLQKLVEKDCLADAERMSLALKELHVG